MAEWKVQLQILELHLTSLNKSEQNKFLQNLFYQLNRLKQKYFLLKLTVKFQKLPNANQS